MKKIKVAVIGTGHLGKIHARIYSQFKGVELVGVCDIDEKKASECGNMFKTSSFTDYTKLVGK